ncbi:thioredoxin TrxC [Vibrio sp. HN007]|uniref:thioredoxin TrxC n=1 Tax=Vibrio iocasae TaxID=3098914 RepID=UPI0035D4B959
MSTFNTRCPSCSAMNRVPLEKINEKGSCGKCKSSLLDGSPVEATTSNYNAIINSDKPVVVDFWAPWCQPCLSFAPAFTQVAQERNGDVRFVKVDTEAQQMLAAQYQIRSIPTIMVFKNGQKVDMINGALPKTQFDSWLDAALLK